MLTITYAYAHPSQNYPLSDLLKIPSVACQLRILQVLANFLNHEMYRAIKI